MRSFPPQEINASAKRSCPRRRQWMSHNNALVRTRPVDNKGKSPLIPNLTQMVILCLNRIYEELILEKRL